MKTAQELAPLARERAQQAAEEHGVSIENICIKADARTGALEVIVLDDDDLNYNEED